MNSIRPLLQGLCALICVAAVSVSSATTLTFSGVVDGSIIGTVAAGSPWEITVVLSDPLADTSGGVTSGEFLYVPVSATVTLGSWTETSSALSGSYVKGAYNSSGVYGTEIQLGIAGLGVIGAGLGAATEVTSPTGLLLPTLDLSSFDSNVMMYFGSDYAMGHVTAYSIETENAVPDTGSTSLLLLCVVVPVLVLFRVMSPSLRPVRVRRSAR